MSADSSSFSPRKRLRGKRSHPTFHPHGLELLEAAHEVSSCFGLCRLLHLTSSSRIPHKYPEDSIHPIKLAQHTTQTCKIPPYEPAKDSYSHDNISSLIFLLSDERCASNNTGFQYTGSVGASIAARLELPGAILSNNALSASTLCGLNLRVDQRGSYLATLEYA